MKTRLTKQARLEDHGPPPVSRKKSPLPIVDDAMIERTEILGGLGLTSEQIHDFYGLWKPQWDLLVKRYPALAMAIRRGRAQRLKYVVDKLWEKIEAGNFNAIVFYLKTQGGWREKDNLTIQVDQLPPSPTPRMVLPVHDAIEAAKIYQQLMVES